MSQRLCIVREVSKAVIAFLNQFDTKEPPMAVTQADLDQLRSEVDAKLARVTIEHMNTATAIGAYAERFNAMDAQFVAVDRRFNEIDRRLDRMDDRFDRVDSRFDRLENKLDSRFGWQTVMFTALGLLTLFGDAVRGALGL
jgi:hypothetical protein